METILSVRGLRKRYKAVQALDGIDLDVQSGEVFGFLGPNGAGKTTFTKCVTGFVSPQEGQVEIMGIDALARPSAAAQHIGLVPDQYDFYPNLTGRQHLEFYGRIMGLPTGTRRRRIAEVLGTVRMEEHADRRTKGYSHGMKQRICIAQAILHKPRLIFFDEPTNGLDPKGAYELRQLIKSLAADGHTIFLNSHLLNEVQETCGRVAIVDRGVVLAVERVDTLRARFSGEAPTVIRVRRPSQAARAALEKVVGPVSMEGQERYLVRGDEAAVARGVAELARAGAQVVEVRPGQASLESVFLKMTEESQ